MSSATSSIKNSARPDETVSAVAAGVVLATTGLLAAFAEVNEDRAKTTLSVGGRDIPALCAIRYLTGRRCPGCGMATSFVSIWRGEARRALRANPFGPALFAVMLGLVVRGRLSYKVSSGGRPARVSPSGSLPSRPT
jgi:hypothetical protein